VGTAHESRACGDFLHVLDIAFVRLPAGGIGDRIRLQISPVPKPYARHLAIGNEIVIDGFLGDTDDVRVGGFNAGNTEDVAVIKTGIDVDEGAFGWHGCDLDFHAGAFESLAGQLVEKTWVMRGGCQWRQGPRRQRELAVLSQAASAAEQQREQKSAMLPQVISMHGADHCFSSLNQLTA
jgi:hypothetical protein